MSKKEIQLDTLMQTNEILEEISNKINETNKNLKNTYWVILAIVILLVFGIFQEAAANDYKLHIINEADGKNYRAWIINEVTGELKFCEFYAYNEDTTLVESKPYCSKPSVKFYQDSIISE